MWRSETTGRCHEDLSKLKNLNTRDWALEGSELFGSTKWNLNLPPDVDCDLHWSDKLNYSIPRPNTRVRRACIKDSLNYGEHDVAHTTLVLEIGWFSSHWHVAKLPTNSTNRCWAMQANPWTLCNVKVGIGKHGTPTPTYKELKKEWCSTNNVENEFSFALMTSIVV